MERGSQASVVAQQHLMEQRDESKPHRTRAVDKRADAAPWPYTQQSSPSNSIISPFLLHLARLLRKALSSSIIEAHNSSTLLPPVQKPHATPPPPHYSPIPSIITLPSYSTKTYLRRRTRGPPARRPAARPHGRRRGRASSSESCWWVCCLCGVVVVERGNGAAG